MDEDRQSDEAGDRDALKGPASAPAPPLDAEPEQLPHSVRRSLDHCAEQWVNRCDGAVDAAGGRRAVPAPILLRRRRSWLPWTVAGASLLLAMAGWWPRFVDLETESAASDFGQWRAQMARERMLAGTPGIGHWRWAGDAGGGAGDVVWDRQRQRGREKKQGGHCQRSIQRAIRGNIARAVVLVGEQESAFSRPAAHDLARRIPGAGLRESPGAGHLHPLTSPDWFVREVEQWLSGL